MLLHYRLMDASSSLVSGPREAGQAVEESELQEPDHFDPSSRAATSSLPSHQADVRPADCRKQPDAIGDGIEEKSSSITLSARTSKRHSEAERPSFLEIDDQFCLDAIVVPLGLLVPFQRAGTAPLSVKSRL
jgi:hypothetical protein